MESKDEALVVDVVVVQAATGNTIETRRKAFIVIDRL